ncbi:MAG TPA: uracil-DNA glycosylase [Nevskiaceae bacterium]|nr:uracil-DNA glycosylase [Nevskiaceae bacterium]
MTPERRTAYLQALDLPPWRARGAAPTEPLAALTRPLAEPAAPEPAPLPAAAAAVPEADDRAPAAGSAPPAPMGEPVAGDWEGLRAQVRDCQRCKLCTTRTQTVFGVGPQTAPLLIVGEGPGADEDAQGEPFVGRAGKLLDEMLAAIGRSRRDSVFIANVVKCRPPGNRDPESDEVEACRPYLEQQIRLLQPRLIVGLGRIAAQRLLRSEAPLSKLRGPLHRDQGSGIPVFITYHPAYLLRSPREKAKTWADLKQVARWLRDAPG